MHSEDDEAGRPDAASGHWLPFGQRADVWHHEAAEHSHPTLRPERDRHWGMVGGIVFLGLVIAGGGGAFGADAYATHAICAAVGETGPGRTPDGAARNSAVALDKARKTLDDTAALLLFHPELRDATRGLARDLADMWLLQDAGGPSEMSPDVTGKLLVVAASVDTHARQAQTACGLPAEGVLNAPSIPRLPMSATSAPAAAEQAAASSSPGARFRTSTSSPAAAGTGSATEIPAGETANSEAAGNGTAGNGTAALGAAGSQTAGSGPPTAGKPRPPNPGAGTPHHTATASDLWSAEQLVTITARNDSRALASPTASPVERQVTSYEHAAAIQHLVDLRAGTPNVPHHDLDVRGAKARLAAADEDYRRLMVNPASSPLDRSQARAVVEQWNETLDRLEH